MMYTPNTSTFFSRRVTRNVLTEIPTRQNSTAILDNPRNVTQTSVPRGLLNVNGSLDLPDSPLSPEEIVIQQRGRRRLPATWSPDIDAKKREGPPPKERTPIKLHMKDSSVKSSIVLRSSPRKRLVLTEHKDSSLCSPEKLIKKVSPTKKFKADKLGTKPSCCSDQGSNVCVTHGRSSSFQSALKGLSQDQLIKVFENILVKYPHLKSDILEILPAPDIKPLEEKLIYLKKNIFKSLPNSRLTSKTDSPAYSRAATHVKAFKKCVIEQGKTLVESQHWNSVLEYVVAAWAHVKATPLWDNPPHNMYRKQCFKSLAAMAINAVKRGSWSSEEVEEIYSRFKNCDESNEEIQTCLKLISSLREVRNF